MENAMPNCPFPPDLQPEDQAVFERVWRRVMPEARADCPITVDVTPEITLQGGDLPCTCICPRSAVSADVLTIRESGSPHLNCDFPDEEDVPRLGRSSSIHGVQLQRQTLDALECWQLYRHLARRAGGSCARTLSALSADKQKTARRLATAYFLISGVRWWPLDRLAAPHIPSFQGTLRQGFQREQHRALAYDAAAADTGDEALAELYRELARQSREHSASLRGILEQIL